uniref:Uncharacterized protein n=1 Tax=Anguilla anguilla TaxID=7936 RepID=A0A0E9S4Q8_ANGAN
MPWMYKEKGYARSQHKTTMAAVIEAQMQQRQREEFKVALVYLAMQKKKKR